MGSDHVGTFDRLDAIARLLIHLGLPFFANETLGAEDVTGAQVQQDRFRRLALAGTRGHQLITNVMAYHWSYEYRLASEMAFSTLDNTPFSSSRIHIRRSVVFTSFLRSIVKWSAAQS